MSTRRLEAMSWAVVTVLALTAVHGWRSAVVLEPEAAAALPPAVAEPVLVDGDSLDEASVHVVEHDPFRFARRPSDVPYAPGIELAPLPAAPKPVLVLTGILGGPPWQGVVEGFPGASGSTVVQEGQVVGDLRVARVSADQVIVEGADTTWTLAVRRAW